MTTTMTDAEARAAHVAAGGAFLDVREPGWLSRIDLDRLDLFAPCDCVLGQLATEKCGDLGTWTWIGICAVFGIAIWREEGQTDYDLGFNADTPENVEPASREEFAALTAEWRRYIERRRAAA